MQTEYPAAALPTAADKPTDHGTSSDTASGILNLIARLRQFVYQQFPMTFPFLVGVWLIGVGVYSLRFAGGIFRFRRYRIDGQVPLGHEWQVRFDSLCKKIGVKQTVKLILSNVVGTPIAIGIFKPLIIVPASVFLQIDPRQLESIIMHELIHIRRFDPVVNVLQNAAEVLFFYHPGIWWISAAIRREREFATDEAVIEACQGDRVVYASALANLEAIRLSANMTVPSNAMAANGGNLMQRIKRILNKKTETSSASSAWSAGIAVGIISILLLALFSFSPSSVVNGQKRGDSDRKVAIGFVGIPLTKQ